MEDDEEFSPQKRKEEVVFLTAKVTSYKVKDDKIYFQVFTFINRDVSKKLLKTIEEFKSIGIEIGLMKKGGQKK